MDLTCFSCRRPLEDAHVSRGGQNYHPHHFKCRECPLPFNLQDAIFWHENVPYCRFHYSTRFAPKCAGCTTAVFSQHIAFGGEDECWHFECYLLNVLWSIKLAPPGRQIKFGYTPGVYAVEESYYNSQSLVAEQIEVEAQVHHTWECLCVFTLSMMTCLNTCTSMIGHDTRSGEKEAWLAKLKKHSAAILEVLEVLEPRLHDADVDAPRVDGRMLGERLWYLAEVCHRGSSRSFSSHQLEEIVHLVHGMTRRAVAGAFYLSREQEQSGTHEYVLYQLRSATTEGTPVLRLAGLEDLKIVYETSPFDILLGKLSLGSPAPASIVMSETATLAPPEVKNKDSKAQPQDVVIPMYTPVTRRSETPSPSARRRLRSPPPQVPQRRRPQSPARRVLQKRPKTPPAALTLATPRSRTPRATRRRSRSRSPRGAKRRSRSRSPRAAKRRSRSKSPRAAKRRSRSRSPRAAIRRPRSRSRSPTPRGKEARGRSRTPFIAAMLPTPRTRSPRAARQHSQSRSITPTRKGFWRKPRNQAQGTTRAPRSNSPRAHRHKSRSRSPLFGVRRQGPRSPPRSPKSPYSLHFPSSSQSNNPDMDHLDPSSRNLFRSVPSSSASLTMAIQDLSRYLRSTPRGHILSLMRRKDVRGVKHEFLVMRAQEPRGRIIWIRMERAANRTQPGLGALVSKFPARDTARICGTEEDILSEEERSTVEAEVHFDSPPTLLHLDKLLNIVTEESVHYTLWPENCFFFASVIQEILSARHNGRLISGKLGHKNLARAVRNRIRTKVEELY